MTPEQYMVKRAEIVSEYMEEIAEHESAGEFGDAEKVRPRRVRRGGRVSEELRPCVFCGHDGARVVVEDYVTDAGCEEATVPLYAASCPYCGARGTMALSEDEAVEAWNRRAERTCQIVVSIDRNPASYGGKVHRCSSCGKALPGALFRNGWTQLDYCPRCGARVTGVVRDAD